MILELDKYRSHQVRILVSIPSRDFMILEPIKPTKGSHYSGVSIPSRDFMILEPGILGLSHSQVIRFNP